MIRKPEPERKARGTGVKREEWDAPSGAHVVSVEFDVDSKEAAYAIEMLVRQVADFKTNKTAAEVQANATWAGGYIAALVMVKAITPAQADQLQGFVDNAAGMAVNNLGYKVKMGKRG